MTSTSTATYVIDPPVQVIIDAIAGANADPAPTLEEERKRANDTMLLLARAVPDTITLTDHSVPVAGGAITVRTYRAESAPAIAPAYLFIHGGGWFQGNIETSEIECWPLAEATGAVVASVDYRLAPEHKFPTAVDDCVAAYTWLHAHAAELGIDPSRVAVGGGSAGGNLSAALCLIARDTGLPMPCLQLLDIPCVDATCSTPSIDELADGYGLTKAAIETYLERYLNDPSERTDPRMSPRLAADLSGLPPAVVFTAELDPLRDDGEAYVKQLRQAGVAAAAFRVTGHIHGSWIIPITISSALVHDLHVSALRRAFDGTLNTLFV